MYQPAMFREVNQVVLHELIHKVPTTLLYPIV